VGKIIVSEFLSLDGVMEDPRWTFQFPPSEDYLKAKLDELFTSEALLLGRVTYEGFAAAWPSMQKDSSGYTDRMNSLPKYVVSTKLNNAKWHNSKIIRDNVAGGISQLKKEGDGNILIFGSCDLTNSLARDGLIDQYNLWVYPLVLGKGKRLFKDGTSLSSLKLLEARSFDSGVVLLRYDTI
jgi:dihydrofolate reductase